MLNLKSPTDEKTQHNNWLTAHAICREDGAIPQKLSYRGEDMIGDSDEDNIKKFEYYKAIVDKLPKTADGVPVYDGMDLYAPEHKKSYILEPEVKTSAYWITLDGQHVVDCVDKFYSTLEASKKAQKGNQ